MLPSINAVDFGLHFFKPMDDLMDQWCFSHATVRKEQNILRILGVIEQVLLLFFSITKRLTGYKLRFFF